MKKNKGEGDLRINFSIWDARTEQVFFKVTAMKSKDFIDNWPVFRGKIQ